MIQSFDRSVRVKSVLLFAWVAAFGSAPIAMLAHGDARAQEAASAVQDLELKDVAVAFGDARVSVPKLTVSGTRLTKDDILEIFATNGKEALSARLARLDASSFAAPEMRVEQSDGTRRQIAIYREVTAKGIHGGRIAELTVSGATVSVEGGPQSGQGSYGPMRAEDIDLTTLARLYNETGDAKGPFQRLYGGYSISDIAFTGDKGSVSIARISGKDAAGRAIPQSWAGATKLIGALGQGADGSGAIDPIERAKAFGALADFLDSVSIGSAEISGITVTTKEREPATFGIGRLAYASDGPAPATILSDFSFSGGGTNLKVAELTFSGYSIAPTLATLRQIASKAEISDSDVRRLTPEIGTLTLTGLAIDLAEEPPVDEPVDPIAKGANGQTNGALHVGLREGKMSFGPPRDGVPIAGLLNLSGLTLPSSAVAGIPGLGSLGLYGYRDLDLKLVADTVWNEQSKELALREVSVSGKDMGTLRINATLGGIGPDVFDPDIAVSTYAMLATTAKALDLTLENGGLLERFLDAQAKTLSLKPDELRKEYVTASVVGVPVILGNSAAAKAIGAAMGKFVAKPGRLSISAKAKNGTGLGVVDFSTAVTPGAVLDKLEVDAKAE